MCSNLWQLTLVTALSWSFQILPREENPNLQTLRVEHTLKFVSIGKDKVGVHHHEYAAPLQE
nr:hypothetical protein Q903MT_gene3173 [Picea sitchensis]